MDEGEWRERKVSNFFSPYLNHFIQPDSIVPNLASPQNFNRFGYVLNNPIKFNDPTGHEAGSYCDRGYCDEKGKVIKADSPKNKFFDKPKPKISSNCQNRSCVDPQSSDALIWAIFPSAIGIDYGVTWQSGFGFEGTHTVENLTLYNLRSKQKNSFITTTTNNAGLYLGSLTGLSITGYFGVTTYYGVSENKFVLGDSLAVGAGGQIDAIAKAGVNKVFGIGITESGDIFVDPVSEIPVTFRQTNITFSLNAIPDGFDVGLFGGSFTTKPKE